MAGGTTTEQKRVAELVSLAEQHEEHLHALVRANPKIFLDPQQVGGDVCAPLTKQLHHFLSCSGPQLELLEDMEHALLTGIIQGAAKGEESDDDDDEDDEPLPLGWRDDRCEAVHDDGTTHDCAWLCVFWPCLLIMLAQRSTLVWQWAVSLRDAARHARGCVFTLDGHCVGPIAFEDWVRTHLPSALATLHRCVSAATPTPRQALAEVRCVVGPPTCHATQAATADWFPSRYAGT